MSAVKEKIIDEVNAMDEKTAGLVLGWIKLTLHKGWEDIQEIEPNKLEFMFAELMLALLEGENSIKDETDWVSIDDVRKDFGV